VSLLVGPMKTYSVVLNRTQSYSIRFHEEQSREKTGGEIARKHPGREKPNLEERSYEPDSVRPTSVLGI
jgi:hypothetical protein